MMMTSVITAGLNAIFLALTPLQRWEAAGRFSTDFMTERWFIITALAAVITLTVLFVVVGLRRKTKERKFTDRSFVEYAQKRGMSERERQILLYIAAKAQLKRSESIFTLASAFNRGAAMMIEETFTQRGAEESAQLKTELSGLREKLGFQKRTFYSVGSPKKSRKLSSRHIPVGKKLHIMRRKSRNSARIECTVIENNDTELTVKLTTPIKITFGEYWCAHYYFGASVWEFDTSVVSYDGCILILNHSDDVRFINRRRFLRVPVNMPAFIARFPFSKALSPNRTLAPPKFIPAVVTELAGLGLRIECPLEVEVGDRVLVVFRLDEEKDQSGKEPTSKMLEDIGEVRNIKTTQNGLSMAVEFVGFSESDLAELIRVTNAASIRAGVKARNIPATAANEQGARERTAEPAAIQGT